MDGRPRETGSRYSRGRLIVGDGPAAPGWEPSRDIATRRGQDNESHFRGGAVPVAHGRDFHAQLLECRDNIL